MITALLTVSLLFAQATPPQSPPPPQQQGVPLPGARVPAEVASTGILRLFLDCQYECDTEYLRKELTFVDHVRDSQSADIHALVTTQMTGGGGTSWKIQFIGVGRFAGHDEAVTFTTPQTATADERRSALLTWLKAGLATHAAMALGRVDFDIVFAKPVEGAAPAAPVHDPWNACLQSQYQRQPERRGEIRLVQLPLQRIGGPGDRGMEGQYERQLEPQREQVRGVGNQYGQEPHQQLGQQRTRSQEPW